LDAFLPKMARANDQMERVKAAGKLSSLDMNAVDENTEEPYIEMDMGLGVLEEKQPHLGDDSSEHDDIHDESDETERDVIGKLMGRRRFANRIEIIREGEDDGG
jgi:hypothetical protein